MSAIRAAAALLLLAAGPAARGAQPKAAESAEERQARARSYFTDTPLLTQDGKKVRFYSDVLEGKVVLLSFLFTRCTDACPLICQKMNQIRTRLDGLFGTEVRFVSISVDPEHDTPRELKKFAAKQKAEHPGWTFLTGKKADVALVLKRLGSFSEDAGNHSTAFIAGNVRRAHWMKIRPDAPPEAVAEQLRGLVSEDAAAPKLAEPAR